MPTRNVAVLCLLAFSLCVTGRWAEGGLPEDAAALRGAEASTVDAAVGRLRDAGPQGLSAALAAYDASPDPSMAAQVDRVAGQRGAVVSRLFWHTDLQDAEAQAQKELKPILYLRMMGRLTDEYSCANSRFFRTVLYSNQQVSQILREQYVLVWVSERPVPVVTIDYGDGRVLKRTLTGNSIHYVLSPRGRVFDAMPGLVGPGLFLRFIIRAGGTARGDNGTNDAVARHLNREDDMLLRAWKQEVAGVATTQQAPGSDAEPGRPARPPALAAAARAISKGAIELPILRKIDPRAAAKLDASIEQADAASWDQAADHEADLARLDAQSIAVIRSQNAAAYADPAALDRVVNHFQRLIALDGVRNNFLLRRRLIGWIRAGGANEGVETLNARVYSELFLTPRSDPWLGIVNDDDYTALNGGGCVVAGVR